MLSKQPACLFHPHPLWPSWRWLNMKKKQLPVMELKWVAIDQPGQNHE